MTIQVYFQLFFFILNQSVDINVIEHLKHDFLVHISCNIATEVIYVEKPRGASLSANFLSIISLKRAPIFCRLVSMST